MFESGRWKMVWKGGADGWGGERLTKRLIKRWVPRF